MRNNPKARIYLESLEEIAESDDFLNAFADETERYYSISAPMGFSQAVLKKSHNLDVQVAVKTRQASKKLQLFTYSLKVGAAVAGALFLLFSLPCLTGPGARTRISGQRVESQVSDSTQRLSDSILNFSYDIFNWR